MPLLDRIADLKAAAQQYHNHDKLLAIIDLFNDPSIPLFQNLNLKQTQIQKFITLLHYYTEKNAPSPKNIAMAFYKASKDKMFEEPNISQEEIWDAAHTLSRKFQEISFVEPAGGINERPETLNEKILENVKHPLNVNQLFLKKYLQGLSLAEQRNFFKELKKLIPNDPNFNDAIIASLEADYNIYGFQFDAIRAIYRDLSKTDGEIVQAIKKRKETADEKEDVRDAKRGVKVRLDALYANGPLWVAFKALSLLEINNLLTQVLTVPEDDELLSDIPESQRGRSVRHTKPITVNVRDASKKNDVLESLREQDLTDTLMQSTRATGPKSGGANIAGEDGNVGTIVLFEEDGNPLVQNLFAKQPTEANGDINYREMMAEAGGAMIMQAAAPDNMAAVSYTNRPYTDNDGKDSNAYLVSIYFDKYMDLNTLKSKVFFNGIQQPRAKGPDTSEQMQKLIKRLAFGVTALDLNEAEDQALEMHLQNILPGLGPNAIQGLGKVIAANWLAGNYQFHTENLALAWVDGKYQFVGIDFGGSLRREFNAFFPGLKLEWGKDFSRHIRPNSSFNRKQRQRYFDSIPTAVRFSKNFIKEIEDVANLNLETLTQKIKQFCDQTKARFSVKIIIDDLLKQLGIEDDKIVACGQDKDKLMQLAEDLIIERSIARAFSENQFVQELKLSAIASPAIRASIPEDQRRDYTLEEIAATQPFYALRAAPHLRDVAKPFSQQISQQLKNLLDEDLEEADPIKKLLSSDLNLIRYPFPDNAIKGDAIKNALLCMLARAQFLIQMPMKRAQKDSGGAALFDLQDFLEKALLSGKYDFKNAGDVAILTQACDKAYQLIGKTLQAFPVAQREILIPLMTIKEDTKTQNGQQLYIQQLQNLTHSTAKYFKKYEKGTLKSLNTEITKQRKNTFGNVFVKELVGISNIRGDTRDEERVRADALSTLFSILKNPFFRAPGKARFLIALDESLLFQEIFSEQEDDIVKLKQAYADYQIASEEHFAKGFLNEKSDKFKQALLGTFAKANENLKTIVKKLAKFQDKKNRKEWNEVIRTLLTLPTDVADVPELIRGRGVYASQFNPKPVGANKVLDMSSSLWVGPKGLGAKAPGPFGGWYLTFSRDETGKIIVRSDLIKQDEKAKAKGHDQNLGEILASRLLYNWIGATTAFVQMAKAPNYPGISGDDAIYIASRAIPNFEAIYERAFEIMRKPIPPSRIIGVKYNPKGQTFMDGIDRMVAQGELPLVKPPYTDLPLLALALSLVANLSIADFDMHSENIDRKGRSVDHGGAHQKLSREVKPHNELSHHFPDPGNHLTDFSFAFRVSKYFTDALDYFANLPREAIKDNIEKELNYVSSYSDKAFEAYAKWVGIKVTGSKKAMIQQLKDELTKIHIARHYSIREYSTELQLYRYAVDPSRMSDLNWKDPVAANKLLSRNLAYFLRGKIHIRDSGGVNAEIPLAKRQQVMQKMMQNSEGIWGISHYLVKDFYPYMRAEQGKFKPQQELKDGKTGAVAEILQARLNLTITILKKFDVDEKIINDLEGKLLDLEDARDYFKEKDTDGAKKILIQVCDVVHNLILDTYQNLPTNAPEKAAIHEVFKSISEEKSHQARIDGLKLATNNIDKVLASVRDSAEKLAFDGIQEKIDEQEKRLESAVNPSDITSIQEKLDSVETDLNEVEKLFAAKNSNLHQSIADVRDSAQRESETLRNEAQAITDKHPEGGAIIQESYGSKKTSDEVLGGIPVREEFLSAHPTARQAAMAQFQATPAQQKNVSNLTLEGQAKVQRMKTKQLTGATSATVYPDPTDEGNYTNTNKPVSGILIEREFEGKKVKHLKAQEYAQSAAHRLTYRIAQNLLTKSIEGTNKSLFRLKNSTGIENDTQLMESIVKDCLQKANITPEEMAGEKPTNAKFKKFYDLMKNRSELIVRSAPSSGLFRSKLLTKENMHQIIVDGVTSKKLGYANLEPPELMAYAKLWAAQLVNVIKREGNGIKLLEGTTETYDPKRISLKGNQDINFPLLRSILLAIAATYNFSAKELNQVHLSPAIQKKIAIVDDSTNQRDSVQDKLVITNDDIRDAKIVYEDETNELHIAINKFADLDALRPPAPGAAAAA